MPKADSDAEVVFHSLPHDLAIGLVHRVGQWIGRLRPAVSDSPRDLGEEVAVHPVLPSQDDSALKAWQDCSIKRRGIAEILAEARGRLHRLTPAEAETAMREGATLVDTRDRDLRSRDGQIPGSVHIPLSVLEWRVDPTSGHQSPAIAGREDRLILICQVGYSSSLAAVRLHDLGFAGTTDVIGGFVAWAAAGLPVER